MRTRFLLLALLVMLLAVSAALAKEEAFLEPSGEDWAALDATHHAVNNHG